ncbi:MAG: hypothetical protein ABMA15_15560 [Vicinamibacterales bacterium]
MTYTFRANDTVKHAPSNETWVLACDQDREDVLPAGWPETIAKATDCVLVRATSDTDRHEMLAHVATTGSYRGSVARRQLGQP